MLVHQLAEETGVPLLERLFASITQLFHIVQVLEHLPVALLGARVLVLKDAAGVAREAGEEEKQVVLEVEHRVHADGERRCRHRVVRVEGEAGHAAYGCDILVLLADWFAKPVDFDVAGEFGQLHLIEMAAAMGVERLKQGGREAAGASQAGSGRNVGERCDFDLRSLEAQQTSGLHG